MKLIATMPVRNEDWILGVSARAALMWCDEVVALDHASTDGTRAILSAIAQEHPGRVSVLPASSEDTWREMEHRQLLLDFARDRGATHIAIVDADEVLTANCLPSIRAMIARLAPATCLHIPMRNMYTSFTKYRDDQSVWGSATTTVAFSDHAELCWRPAAGYQHHHREPFNHRGLDRRPLAGGVMHLQFVSYRRLTAKHAWYQMQERIAYPKKPVSEIAHMYSQAPDWSRLVTRDAPAEWWDAYQHLLPYADVQKVSWHEAEIIRLIKEHGVEKFRGLKLFGYAGLYK